MNVIEEINQKLTGKDWSLKEKERFLYLQSCLYFAYDNRWFFLPFLDLKIHEKTADEMRDKIIDLEHVDDNLAICTSHIYHVLHRLYQEFLGIPMTILDDGHAWLELPNTPFPTRADAIIGYDIARVKMKLNTEGFRYSFRGTSFSEKEKEPFREKFNQKLFSVDQRIGYVDEYDYSGKLDIQHFLKNVEQNSSHIFSTSELIRYVFALLEQNITQYPFLHFSDVETFLSNYLNDFIEQFHYIINDVRLFQISHSGQWNFATIYVVQLKQERLFFVLEDFNQNIRFYEIAENEAIHYANNMNGYSRHLILDGNSR